MPLFWDVSGFVVHARCFNSTQFYDVTVSLHEPQSSWFETDEELQIMCWCCNTARYTCIWRSIVDDCFMADYGCQLQQVRHSSRLGNSTVCGVFLRPLVGKLLGKTHRTEKRRRRRSNGVWWLQSTNQNSTHPQSMEDHTDFSTDDSYDWIAVQQLDGYILTRY